MLRALRATSHRSPAPPHSASADCQEKPGEAANGFGGGRYIVRLRSLSTLWFDNDSSAGISSTKLSDVRRDPRSLGLSPWLLFTIAAGERRTHGELSCKRLRQLRNIEADDDLAINHRHWRLS